MYSFSHNIDCVMIQATITKYLKLSCLKSIALNKQERLPRKLFFEGLKCGDELV